jgi:hypothetical protein
MPHVDQEQIGRVSPHPCRGEPSDDRASLSSAASEVERVLEFPLQSVPIVLCCAAIGMLVWNLDRGLDLTDEGFYLLWARSPEDVVGVRNFGHYTGVLFDLVGQSIWGLRPIGLVLLLALAGAFGSLFASVAPAPSDRPAPQRWARLSLASTVTLGALGYYGLFWCPTPSYNWLVLMSQLLGFTGLLLWGFPPRWAARWAASVGGASFGAAVVLAFMGKPPSAAAFAAVGAVWVLLHSRTSLLEGGAAGLGSAGTARPSWRRFTAAASIGALLLIAVHAVAFDAPSAWYAQLRDGYGLIMSLGGQQPGLISRTLRTLLGFPASAFAWAPIWWTGGLIVLGAILKRASGEAVARLASSAAILGLGAELAIRGAWTGGFDRPGIGAGQAVAVIAAGTTAVALVRHLLRPCASSKAVGACLLLTLLLASGALVYGFASTNGILVQAGGAAVFFAAAGVLPARLLGRLPVGAFTAAVSLALVTQLHDSMAHPYRLAAPVAEQRLPVSVGVPGTSVKLDTRTARYFSELMQAAEAGDFAPGTALIDMTGGSPAAVFAIGGRAPVSPWMPGSYYGSTAFAAGSLARVPAATLQLAWVLSTPDGPRRLSDEILPRAGLDFPSGYIPVAELHSPTRGELQILWRPDATR